MLKLFESACNFKIHAVDILRQILEMLLFSSSLQQQIFSWRRRRCCTTCGKDKVGPVSDDGQGRDVEMMLCAPCGGRMEWSTHGHVGSGHRPHGMVHTPHMCEVMGWSTHGHTVTRDQTQEQDTHWASPCPLPGSSRDSCP